MAGSSAGLYVHVPWCRSICSYCDFDRQAHGFEQIPAYVDALVLDIQRQPRAELHSAFFGGGTPSLLESEQVAAILGAVGEHFEMRDAFEITLEANPGDLSVEKAMALRRAGVNRLSLGIQTSDDSLLKILGRRHTALEAEQAFRDARAAGFENLSFDLMYGLPGQTPEHWRRTLDRAAELGADHISAYLLTIDDRVPLGRRVSRGSVSLPLDDQIAGMYDDAQRALAAVGYEQYEISNWAVPGKESRHNLTYWRDEPYLAVGAGAAGSYAGRRFKNTLNARRYIRAVRVGIPELVEDETPTQLMAAQDFLALGLRPREGLDLERFEQRFGLSFWTLAGDEGAGLLRAGVLERCATGRARLAAEHLLVSNEVIVRLHDALEQGWKRLGLPVGGLGSAVAKSSHQ